MLRINRREAGDKVEDRGWNVPEEALAWLICVVWAGIQMDQKEAS